jgi:hypothetical protein
MSDNPFITRTPGHNGGPTYYYDADSRLARVKEFNLTQLNQALMVEGLQKSVKTAIERRIRKLVKELLSVSIETGNPDKN